MYTRRCGGCRKPIRIMKLAGVGWVLVQHHDGRKLCSWSGEVVGAPRKTPTLNAALCRRLERAKAKTWSSRLAHELKTAETKAWASLGKYKFQMFGYWAAIWVHLNRLGGFKLSNPWGELVKMARRHQSNFWDAR